MYPPGHPHLQSATERLVSKAQALFAIQPIVVFGIARDQFVVDGAATDPRNSLFRELAEKLHRHRLATLRITRGVTADQLSRLVGLLSADPATYARGGLLAEAGALEHVQLQAIEYGRIVLEEGENGADATLPVARRSEDLWLDLARLTAESKLDPEASEEAEPTVLAKSIDWGSREAGYDREVLRRLTRLAEDLAGHTGPPDPELHARLSKLLTALRPGTLARLLAAGEDDEERKRFVTAATATLDTDAVMNVLEAVASASNQQVSHHLLRLLRKMGMVNHAAPPETLAAADSAVRTNVNRLLDDWRLDDPNPEAYTAALDSMALSTTPESGREEACDPLIILQAALEAGVSGPRTDIATDDVLAAGRLDELVEVLGNSPNRSAADAVWRRVATPARLRHELQRGALTSQSTAAIIARLGEQAVDPLLEILATADDRATRAAALRLLGGLGAPAADRAVALLPDAPWYVQRNLFVLLSRLGPWPPKLPTPPYLSHADARVRREAIKLILESPGRRDVGLAVGIMDADDAIRGLALSAALEGCPKHLIPTVRQLVADPECRPPTRALAIRVLARSGEPEVVDTLVDIALARKLRFLYRRIASKSPEVLAALAGLAGRWRDDPRAAEVLARARRHRDLEIRTAAAEGA
jgi:HEAT repeat protein